MSKKINGRLFPPDIASIYFSNGYGASLYPLFVTPAALFPFLRHFANSFLFQQLKLLEFLSFPTRTAFAFLGKPFLLWNISRRFSLRRTPFFRPAPCSFIPFYNRFFFTRSPTISSIFSKRFSFGASDFSGKVLSVMRPVCRVKLLYCDTFRLPRVKVSILSALLFSATYRQTRPKRKERFLSKRPKTPEKPPFRNQDVSLFSPSWRAPECGKLVHGYFPP